MERLTERTENGTLRPKRKCSDCIQLEDRNLTDCTHECECDVISRLAEYEDTNLTPDQFKELNKLYLEKCEEINRLKENQTPKKPISKTFGYAGEVPYTKFMCPTGCCKIAIHRERDNYCPNCGVKIDWSVGK